MADKVRLRMSIKLFKDGEMVKRVTYRKKSSARAFIKYLSAAEWTSGIVRVWYNVAEEYWNEFEFHSYEDFDKTLSTDTEKDLVQTFVTVP